LPTNLETILGLIILGAAPFAFFFYYGAARKAQTEGGKVGTGWVSYPDIALALTLGGALAGLAINGLTQTGDAPKVLKADQVIPGMIFLLVIAGGVATFLVTRKISLPGALGLGRVSTASAIGRGFYMLLLSFPIVMVFGMITLLILQEQAQEQELVKLFTEVARNGDRATVFNIFVAGVIVAPICEEVIFRGYFYPVAKRFLGPFSAVLIVSALFAATHVNLASLLGLLALAVCFTIAYERTGSILVPICMHAFFNGINLLVLYAGAQLVPQ
jgi:membrane protease YdiL (CAAX protease family)